MAATQPLPRKVRLIECFLYSINNVQAQAGIDLRSVISSIDIYESIFDNTISARLILQESVALVELLPIVGAEFVRIAFEIDYDFGQGQEQRQSYTRIVRVQRLCEQIFPEHEVRNYVLELITPEFMNSLSTRISKTYLAKPITTAIREIIEHNLRLDAGKRKVAIEECRGEINVTLANYTPLQAINFFSLIALSKDVQQSSFFFFETLDQFYFTSLQTLFNGPVVGSYDVNANAILSQVRPDQEKAFNTIFSLHQDHTFDVGVDITSGMLRSKMISLDILARKWQEKTSRYTEAFAKTPHVDKYPVYPENFDQTINENVRIFVVPTNAATANYGFNKPNDSLEKELQVHKTVLLRNQQMKALTHLRTRLQVPGQPRLRAGAIIELRYPSSRLLQSGDVGNPQASAPQLTTPYHSGKHLVTAVRHNLVQKSLGTMEYRMDIEAVRDALSSPLFGLPKNATDVDKVTGNWPAGV